jgi:tetratricopeptide (TPR) repeat protein
MNPSYRRSARRRFQLVPGRGEAAQLDRFLIDTDPFLIASLRQEEQRLRRRKWGLRLVVALGLTVAVALLWLAGGLLINVGKSSANMEKAHLLVAQGRELIAADRYDEAVLNFTLAIKLAPDLADAWAELGNCQLHNYQSQLAERAWHRALALEPENSRALDGVGGLHLRRGEEREAEIAWSRGGLDRQLARLYLLEGRYREAANHLAPLLGQTPSDAMLERMALAARLQRVDPGLRSLLEPEPSGLSSWADLGWQLSKENRFTEASQAFAKAITDVPYDVNALSGMGSTLLALHRVPEAKAYFERALQLDNDHALSLNGLAHCLKGEGRTAEAIAVWQGMSELYPGVNYGTPGLAWTYFELRDYRQAALYFARLVKRYPYDSRLVDALNVAVENIGATPSY